MGKPMIVLVKRFTYRGNQEEWSNAYHFAEPPPSNPTNWKTLIDALAAQEKLIYGPDVKIVRAYGYDNSDNDATTMVDYAALSATIPGTLNVSSDIAAPGDAAVTIRWSTAKKSSKGKSVYLRKYYHGAMVKPGVTFNNDQPATLQATALATLGSRLINGTITGLTMCGKDGTAALTAAAGPYVTTRTLKRRGKRPPS